MPAHIKRLSPIHIQAIQMFLEAGDRVGSVKDVADRLGVSPTTVAHWRMSPCWQARWEMERDELEANLRDVPIASRRYRISRRQRELDRLEESRYTAQSLGEVAVAAKATDQLLSSAAKEVEGLFSDPGASRAVAGSCTVESGDPAGDRERFGEYLRAVALEMGLMDRPVRELVARLGVELIEEGGEQGEAPELIAAGEHVSGAIEALRGQSEARSAWRRTSDDIPEIPDTRLTGLSGMRHD